MSKHIDCAEFIRMISEYMDKEIEELMCALLEEHMQECEKCLSLFHTVEKTLSFSREIHKREEVPEQVIKTVSYRIRIRYKK